MLAAFGQFHQNIDAPSYVRIDFARLWKKAAHGRAVVVAIDLREKFRKRCGAPGKRATSFPFALETLGDPTPGRAVDEAKMNAFFALAKRQYNERKVLAGSSKGEPLTRRRASGSKHDDFRSEASQSPEPALKLLIRSPGEGFLCVRTPETAGLLRKRGLLPLPHDAAAQLQVNFEQPRHFCLFAFGPDKAVHPYVPHKNLPAGEARARLIIPDDLEPGMQEISFSGPGGAESFLLLVGRRPLTKASAKAAQKVLAWIFGHLGTIRLPDPAEAFVKNELLQLSDTKALPLSNVRESSEPLDRLIAAIRNEFNGPFDSFHFISVHRLNPP